VSGVATLTAPVVEAFVPQMLNYESLGGVNFKKGCYPGQEVVARSQFRGTLKRRAYLVHAGPGRRRAEVFAPKTPSSPWAWWCRLPLRPGGGMPGLAADCRHCRGAAGGRRAGRAADAAAPALRAAGRHLSAFRLQRRRG
jgi:folate-binding protein YgfZ